METKKKKLKKKASILEQMVFFLERRKKLEKRENLFQEILFSSYLILHFLFFLFVTEERLGMLTVNILLLLFLFFKRKQQIIKIKERTLSSISLLKVSLTTSDEQVCKTLCNRFYSKSSSPCPYDLFLELLNLSEEQKKSYENKLEELEEFFTYL